MLDMILIHGSTDGHPGYREYIIGGKGEAAYRFNFLPCPWILPAASGKCNLWRVPSELHLGIRVVQAA